MKKIILTFIGIAMLSVVSCTDDLNTEPQVELSLEQLLSQDPNAVEGILSRLYASYALSGTNGPGSSDITSPDAGEGAFLRAIVNLQDFTGDGMKNRWGDDGLDQLTTTSNWDSNNKFFRLFYDRAYYTIPQCNNLIPVLDNVDIPNKEGIKSEVRFLRALAYYNLMDTFGKGVLVTENELGVTTPLPEASRQQLFDFVESELLAIEGLIGNSNGYGRANTYVVDMLLSKLYLNAQVYTGTARWDEALTYSNKVITEGGYMLTNNFLENFSGDNDTSSEIIFPLIADAVNSQSFGNTTYLVNGNLSPDTMTISDFGSSDGWQGHRASKGWYGLFGDLDTSNDDRAELFWTEGHNFEMADYREWTDGYPSTKFRNTDFGELTTPTPFSGTDFPFYRLADAYLMYAEATLRGGAGGSTALALEYVNNVRTRSNATPVTATDLDLDYILDERARELNLEGQRRSDLIRFGKFTGGSYLWPWKGGTLNGTSIPDTYRLFPIPQTALEANPNLQQNPGF